MKILILTQVIDTKDPVLGFFHRWVEEFAKNVEQVTVICLREGTHNFPHNVKVLSLGKEKGVSRFTYIINFYAYILKERRNYDAVFVHMNQIYVILGGVLWRMWRKRIGLWYTHKTVSLSLRFAEKLAHVVFSASETSFRLPSKKLIVTGHGIDTNMFVPKKESSNKEQFKVLTAGRIAAVKGHTLILHAVHALRKQGIDARLTIVGAPATDEDRAYQKSLQEEIVHRELNDFVVFTGSVPHAEMVRYFQESDVFVNASGTESLDKTILESLSCETLVVSSNDSATVLLKDICPQCIFEKQDLNTLVTSLVYVKEQGSRLRIGEQLRAEVVSHHNLDTLIRRLTKIMTYEE